MKIIKFTFYCFFIFMSNFSSFAQTENLSTTSKKAKSHFEKAIEYLNQRKDDQGEKELKKAIESDDKFIEAWTVLADIYSTQKKSEKAIECYKKAIQINPDFFPNNFNSLGEELFVSGNYGEAKINFEKFLTYTTKNKELHQKAKLNLAKSKFAEIAIQNPVPFKPINMGSAINSKFEEYLPTITADQKTMIVTVRAPYDTLKEESGSNILTEDFYESKYLNGKWTKRSNIGAPINTYANEGAQSISADGQMLFFCSCADVAGQYPEGRKGYGSCDIFYSVKVGNRWSIPKNIGAPINSKYWESQPSIASDGRTLYFTSNRSGGKGKEDLYVTKLKDDGTWSNPENLGDSINTPYSEISPFIHPDNETFYFASDGHAGMGKKDIYYTKRKKDISFSVPVNLGYPINTKDEESSLIISADGKTAYYDSERPEGFGKTDIYQFELYEKVRPVPVTYVKGKIYNSENQNAEEARIELYDLSTGNFVSEAYSNKGNGEYLICLPIGKKYAFNVDKKGFLFFSENFSLEKADSDKSYSLDIPLKPLKQGQLFVLNNIFFETGKFNLMDESKTELEKLFQFLKANSSVRIEISGHTDNIGDKQKNIELSNNRAKAVLDYLISRGIETTRLEYKGYGDTKPVESNETNEGRAKNRRTEIKIL